MRKEGGTWSTSSNNMQALKAAGCSPDSPPLTSKVPPPPRGPLRVADLLTGGWLWLIS